MRLAALENRDAAQRPAIGEFASEAAGAGFEQFVEVLHDGDVRAIVAFEVALKIVRVERIVAVEEKQSESALHIERYAIRVAPVICSPLSTFARPGLQRVIIDALTSCSAELVLKPR